MCGERLLHLPAEHLPCLRTALACGWAPNVIHERNSLRADVTRLLLEHFDIRNELCSICSTVRWRSVVAQRDFVAVLLAAGVAELHALQL